MGNPTEGNNSVPRFDPGSSLPAAAVSAVGGPAGSCRTSLVSNGHNGEWESGPIRCDRVRYDFVYLPTGERVSGRCKAYGCPYCGPRKLWVLEAVLVAAMPERMLTLTLAPEDSTRRRKQVAWLMQSLRRDGYRCEIAWTTEPNPKGTGHHIHALQKGSYIPKKVLQSKWGDRIVHVQKLQSVGGGVSAYMLKMQKGAMRAAGYQLKYAGGKSRPLNITKNFLDGRTLEQARRDTRAVLFPESNATDPSDWARVPRGDRKEVE